MSYENSAIEGTYCGGIDTDAAIDDHMEAISENDGAYTKWDQLGYQTLARARELWPAPPITF